MADLASVHADLRAGGAGGAGMFGEREGEAFHAGRGPLAYGIVVGAELFFLDAWIGHDQFVESGSVNGTWTQFMLGADIQLDFGSRKSTSLSDSGKKVGGYNSMFVELGAGLGYGVGTGRQVDPPLDNSEVTDKGFLVESHLLIGYRITTFLALGFDVPMQFGYFTKAGAANDTDNHYSSFGAQGLVTLRGSFKLR